MAAAVDWSYRMLSAAQQMAFRKFTRLPRALTLGKAAQAIAGDGAESHVLRLVDAPFALLPESELTDVRVTRC